MASEPTTEDERRVLLLPPTSRDAQAMRALLTGAGIACAACADMRGLCEAIAAGAGAVVVSEESLSAEPEGLEACVRAQPVWSDVPIVVLSRSGAESPQLGQVLGRMGNVSVLERPVRVTTLVSVVRTALRARERQYQVRDHLAERRRAEERVAELLSAERHARAEAERAGRTKDEFLATLSHELRTPLNAILGWAQILGQGGAGGNGPNPADVRDGLEVIERNARAQTRIIEDLLDMSRIISGRVRLEVTPVDLAAVVRAAVETVKPAADAKGVRVGMVLDSTAGPVSGDPNRLQQVFWNLASNAVKFTPRGGQVQVLLTRVDSHLEVTVSDTGEGIAATFLPHVFDRFRQADGSTTRRHGGLGLGLAIVKQLVELHGGSVAARSAGPGRGSTFVVSLPMPVMQGKPEGVPAEDRRHPSASAGRPMRVDECARIAGLRVLVVDDEPDARELLRRVLEDCGAVVETTASAAEALERVRAGRPDVLVSDIGMPGEDGYALIRKVRALGAEEGRGTPAIALTAYARPEDRVKAVLAGFQHHVTKPVEPVELVALIATVAGVAGVPTRGAESAEG